MIQLAQRARAGEKLTFETRHRRKDGTVFPVEIRTGTFRQGEKLFYLALARDISERKLVEATLRDKDHALQSARDELARVSRVTMMGELTAAIAHEVNQPLGAMVANAAACTRWLAADPPETARTRRALESIAADGRRASEIIGRIRALVKRQSPRKDLVDVNVKVMEVIELAADEIRRNGIVLRTELADATAAGEGRPGAAPAGAPQPHPQRDRRHEPDRATGPASSPSFRAPTARIQCSSRCATRARASTRSAPRRCSSLSTRPSRTGWASGFPSAARSSRRTAGGCG